MSAEPKSAEPLGRALPPAPERVAARNVWRGAYQVGEPFGPSDGMWFTAQRLPSADHVWLRVSGAASVPDRDQVWEVLRAIDSPLLQKPIEVHTGAERVEVWRAPEAPTLRHWRAERPAPGPLEIRECASQLASALELLHARGLGHFALRPDNVFVRPGPAGPEYCLGGFDATVPVNQGALIPIAVDLLRAPPEAAGLFQHSPGPLLLTWDWWSLGRVLQEFILGQPVLMLVPEELYNNPPLSRTQLAENLLFERDVGALRAGAVELMPGLDPETKLLLHGLLTSAHEGRWGAAEVREWRTGARPPARYESPRRQRFFRLDGRGYTPPEAADVLRDPSHSGGMVAQVFGADDPGKFAHFLRETRTRHNYFEVLEQATNLTGAAGLASVPAELVREIAAAVALTGISRGKFFWRGRPITPALADRLRDRSAILETCAMLRALAVPAVLHLLQLHDSTTAGHIEVLVTSADGAEKLQRQCRLAHADPAQNTAELWLLALETADHLAAAVERLRHDFATTTNPALAAIFTHPHPAREMLVVLAWVARDPKRHGCKTHAEVKAEKLAAMLAEGRTLAQLLFWLRLEAALRAGPLLFGNRWLVLAGGLAVILLLAVHLAGPAGLALGLIPFAALAALRVGLNRWQARLVRVWTQSAPWSWRDGSSRCQRETRTLVEARGFPATAAAVSSRLRSLSGDMAGLAQADPYEPVAWPPRHWSTWGGVLAGWVAVALIVAGSVWQGAKHPPSWEAHAKAWQQTIHRPPVEKTVAPEDQKLIWPYKLQKTSPFPPLEVASEGEFVPTPAEAGAALSRARQLLAPYKPESIDALVAIYVPLEGNRGGLLLFDGRKGAAKSPKGVLVGFVPPAKTWLHIGDGYALFIER
jgi:hypothetical protein